MARMEGYGCDVCGTFTTSLAGYPKGWLRIILPTTDQDKHADHDKELCSDKCMVALGKARMAANGISNTRTGKNVTHPELVRRLAEIGIDGRKLGNYIGTHKRFHGNDLQADCLACEFETESAQ